MDDAVVLRRLKKCLTILPSRRGHQRCMLYGVLCAGMGRDGTTNVCRIQRRYARPGWCTMNVMDITELYGTETESRELSRLAQAQIDTQDTFDSHHRATLLTAFWAEVMATRGLCFASGHAALLANTVQMRHLA